MKTLNTRHCKLDWTVGSDDADRQSEATRHRLRAFRACRRIETIGMTHWCDLPSTEVWGYHGREVWPTKIQISNNRQQSSRSRLLFSNTLRFLPLQLDTETIWHAQREMSPLSFHILSLSVTILTWSGLSVQLSMHHSFRASRRQSHLTLPSPSLE